MASRLRAVIAAGGDACIIHWTEVITVIQGTLPCQAYKFSKITLLRPFLSSKIYSKIAKVHVKIAPVKSHVPNIGPQHQLTMVREYGI